jgi:hypothetical protein
MSTKQIEDLKAELTKLKESNQVLFHQNVRSAIKGKMDEFLTAFGDYFQERGFVVSRKADTVRVSYEIIHFKAFSDENQKLYIMKGKEQIAAISVQYAGESDAYPSFQAYDGESISRLKTEIEKEKRLAAEFVNPVVYYTGGDNGPRFDDPFIILNSIFHM